MADKCYLLISKSKDFETKEHLLNQHQKLSINQVTFGSLECREKVVNFTLEQSNRRKRTQTLEVVGQANLVSWAKQQTERYASWYKAAEAQ